MDAALAVGGAQGVSWGVNETLSTDAGDEIG